MNENVLDLSGVFDDEEKAEVKDKMGRVWVIDVDLPGRTLKTFFSDSTAWSSGQLSETQMDRMYGAVHHILLRNQPTATLDDVYDAFSIKDIEKLVRFLFGLLSGEQASGVSQATSTPTPMVSSTSRQSRRASARKSAVVS